MNMNELKDSFPAYAKDTKLNLSNILSEQASTLTQEQTAATALAAAYATKQPQVIAAMLKQVDDLLSQEVIMAAKAAATIMAMNNIYYRFVHMLDDAELSRMPARLRMNVMANPGVDKQDFELYSLGVSIINGCGMCIQAHVAELQKHGVNKDGIQQVARIAAVINSAAQVTMMERDID